MPVIERNWHHAYQSAWCLFLLLRIDTVNHVSYHSYRWYHQIYKSGKQWIYNEGTAENPYRQICSMWYGIASMWYGILKKACFIPLIPLIPHVFKSFQKKSILKTRITPLGQCIYIFYLSIMQNWWYLWYWWYWLLFTNPIHHFEQLLDAVCMEIIPLACCKSKLVQSICNHA